MNVLCLEGVSRRRGLGARAVIAVSDVSLALAPGEVVLLQGPSGSGKTTLLALSAGLLTPDTGRVTLAGKSLDTLTPSARRAHRAISVGFVFQRSALLSRLTARDNIRIMAALGGLTPRESFLETDRLIEELGLERRADHLPAELSGGEEMRVSIARALVHRPALVLADEPTASLDGVLGRQVADLLVSTARTRGAAILIATHDQRLESAADRQLRIVDGRLTSGIG